jgi:hypothetical protein
MAPSKRGATQQVNWRVDSGALDLLDTLGIAPHRRGQFVSSLIRAAAQPPAPADVAPALEPRAHLLALIVEAGDVARALLAGDDPPNLDSGPINKAGSGVDQ